MNNKILSVVLVAGIAATWFAGISSANETGSGGIKIDSEIRELIMKARSGEELSSDEQAKIDEIKAQFSERKSGDKDGKRGFKGHGKRAGFKMLTDEERASLESMTDEQRQEFFATKKAEMQEKREAHKTLIDALIAGETLSGEQEELRSEMLEKISHHAGKRDHAGVIEKLLKGEELTDEDRTVIEEMQAKKAEREAERAKIEAMSDEEKQAYFAEKKAEREAKKEEVKALMEKVRNGEELTEDEQALVDEVKSHFKGKGKRGGHGKGMKDHDRDGDDFKGFERGIF